MSTVTEVLKPVFKCLCVISATRLLPIIYCGSLFLNLIHKCSVFICVYVCVCDGGVVSLRYKDLEAIMLSSV